jgi:hypothetical protein
MLGLLKFEFSNSRRHCHKVKHCQGPCFALQNRLVSLVAGHLLDANDEQEVGKGLPEEYKANLRKNVADAIGILSKLTTGIDVNVRFHDVKGFEFTDEIAIFDLMDISLVHGWLVDPEVTPYILCWTFVAQQYTYLQHCVQLQYKVRNDVYLSQTPMLL